MHYYWNVLSSFLLALFDTTCSRLINIFLSTCVCVCVYEKKRMRERGGGRRLGTKMDGSVRSGIASFEYCLRLKDTFLRALSTLC